jgi:hypothetical protein
MRTIHFKNGTTLVIEQDVVDKILDALVTNPNTQFHAFKQQGIINLVINSTDILYID